MDTNSTYDLVVVGFGGAALSAAVTYIETAAAEGREAKIVMLERAARDERGGATRWTTAGMRLTEDFRLDPLWVGTVQEVSEGLADLRYTQTFEREVPTTAQFLLDHGVELNWSRMPLAGPLQGSASPNGGGYAIVEALAAHVARHPGAEVL
jgi:tricarballylate dehydrogenase